MKRLIAISFFLLVLAGCSADDTYVTIDLEEIQSKVEEGYIVLDVREPNEFEEGHIPNAVNKPLSELQDDDFSTINKDDKYVVICRSGNRSVTASDILHSEGFSIINTSEGMSTWQGEVVK